jgi:hypothetical protein
MDFQSKFTARVYAQAIKQVQKYDDLCLLLNVLRRMYSACVTKGLHLSNPAKFMQHANSLAEAQQLHAALSEDIGAYRRLVTDLRPVVQAQKALL